MGEIKCRIKLRAKPKYEILLFSTDIVKETMNESCLVDTPPTTLTNLSQRQTPNNFSTNSTSFQILYIFICSKIKYLISQSPRCDVISLDHCIFSFIWFQSNLSRVMTSTLFSFRSLSRKGWLSYPFAHACQCTRVGFNKYTSTKRSLIKWLI